MTWSEKIPTERGWYWLYGWMHKLQQASGSQPSLHLVWIAIRPRMKSDKKTPRCHLVMTLFAGTAEPKDVRGKFLRIDPPELPKDVVTCTSDESD